MKKPRVFWIHFNRFNAKRGDAQCWTVHHAGCCHFTKKVICRVRIETIYKGDKAPQPRAILKGKGNVAVYDDYIHIY